MTDTNNTNNTNNQNNTSATIQLISEQERQRRIENVEETLGTHAIERIYPDELTKQAFAGYIEGRYNMQDLKDILINDKDLF